MNKKLIFDSSHSQISGAVFIHSKVDIYLGPQFLGATHSKICMKMAFNYCFGGPEMISFNFYCILVNKKNRTFPKEMKQEKANKKIKKIS